MAQIHQSTCSNTQAPAIPENQQHASTQTKDTTGPNNITKDKARLARHEPNTHATPDHGEDAQSGGVQTEPSEQMTPRKNGRTRAMPRPNTNRQHMPGLQQPTRNTFSDHLHELRAILPSGMCGMWVRERTHAPCLQAFAGPSCTSR